MFLTWWYLLHDLIYHTCEFILSHLIKLKFDYKLGNIEEWWGIHSGISEFSMNHTLLKVYIGGHFWMRIIISLRDNMYFLCKNNLRIIHGIKLSVSRQNASNGPYHFGFFYSSRTMSCTKDIVADIKCTATEYTFFSCVIILIFA